MKITQEEIVDRQTVLNIELEDEDVAPYLDRSYRRLVQKVAIPGFRKGKAPRMVVERFVGRESLLQESLEFALPEVTERAIEEQNLEAVITPQVELVELEPLTFKATVALDPMVELGAYREIRVDRDPIEIRDEDVQKQVEEIRTMSASWDPVERPVASGDMVTMSVLGTVDGRTVLQESDVVYVASDGSSIPFPGFTENLVDATVGSPKEFEVPIPDDYADVNLAGQQALFTVTVNEVKEQRLPELDDEFAKGAGDGYETLGELREAIEKQLREAAEQEETARYRESTLERLAEAASVELPPLLIEHEVLHAESRRDSVVRNLNIRLDDYLRYSGKTQEEESEEMRGAAVRRLTRSYALHKLAEDEKLEVSTEEIEAEIDETLSSGGQAAEFLRQQDPESEEVQHSIRESLLVTKAIDRLAAIALGEAPEPVGADDTDAEEPASDEAQEEDKEGGEAVDNPS